MKQANVWLGIAVCAVTALCAADTAQGADAARGFSDGLYAVQVMALHDAGAAHGAADALRARGYDAYMITVADDTTGLPHKVRLGRFETRQDARLVAADYEMRESAATYVVRDAAPVLTASAQPAAAPVALSAQQSPAASSQNVLQYAAPDGFFGNLLGGRTHLEIRPSFAYRLQYEDNVDYNSSNKISDWSNRYIPAIEVLAIGPRFSISSIARLDIAEYINDREFNYVDQEYYLALGYAPNDRLEISTGVGYSVFQNTNRFFERENIGDPLDEGFDRYKEKAKTLTAGATYVLTPRSTVGLTGYVTRYTVDDSREDNDFFGATAVYRYSYSPKTDLFIRAGYFYYDFKDADTGAFTSYSYELKNYSITGGFDHQVDQNFRFGASAGYRYTENDSRQRTGDDPVDRRSGNGDGWVAAFDIEKRFGDFKFLLEGFHDISISSRGDNYESSRINLTNTYDINRRLSAQLRLWYMRRDSSTGDEFVGRSREQATYAVSPSLNYKLYRWLDLSLVYYYRYTDYKTGYRNANNRHSNLVFLQMRFTPLRPLVIR